MRIRNFVMKDLDSAAIEPLRGPSCHSSLVSLAPDQLLAIAPCFPSLIRQENKATIEAIRAIKPNAAPPESDLQLLHPMPCPSPFEPEPSEADIAFAPSPYQLQQFIPESHPSFPCPLEPVVDHKPAAAEVNQVNDEIIRAEGPSSMAQATVISSSLPIPSSSSSQPPLAITQVITSAIQPQDQPSIHCPPNLPSSSPPSLSPAPPHSLTPDSQMQFIYDITPSPDPIPIKPQHMNPSASSNNPQGTNTTHNPHLTSFPGFPSSTAMTAMTRDKGQREVIPSEQERERSTWMDPDHKSVWAMPQSSLPQNPPPPPPHRPHPPLHQKPTHHPPPPHYHHPQHQPNRYVTNQRPPNPPPPFSHPPTSTAMPAPPHRPHQAQAPPPYHHQPQPPGPYHRPSYHPPPPLVHPPGRNYHQGYIVPPVHHHPSSSIPYPIQNHNTNHPSMPHPHPHPHTFPPTSFPPLAPSHPNVPPVTNEPQLMGTDEMKAPKQAMSLPLPSTTCLVTTAQGNTYHVPIKAKDVAHDILAILQGKEGEVREEGGSRKRGLMPKPDRPLHSLYRPGPRHHDVQQPAVAAKPAATPPLLSAPPHAPSPAPPFAPPPVPPPPPHSAPLPLPLSLSLPIPQASSKLMTTASLIDEEAKEEADQAFLEAYNKENGNISADGEGGKMGFVTAAGSKVQLSEAALNKARAILATIDGPPAEAGAEQMRAGGGGNGQFKPHSLNLKGRPPLPSSNKLKAPFRTPKMTFKDPQAAPSDLYGREGGKGEPMDYEPGNFSGFSWGSGAAIPQQEPGTLAVAAAFLSVGNEGEQV